MATYSSNTTIKYSSAVSATATSTATGGAAGTLTTVYTAGASEFAIINLSLSGTSNQRDVYIGSQIFVHEASTNELRFTGIYVGPSQTVQVQAPAAGGGAGTAICKISGVSFTNTP